LNWNKWIRQTHRWLSMAFTVAVIVNIVAVVQGKYSSGWASWLCSRSPCSCSAVCTCSCCRMPPSGEAGDAPTERAAGPSLRVLCERVGLGGLRKTGLLRESGMPTLCKKRKGMGHSRYRRYMEDKLKS
jgi:hypothetical protein